MSTQNKSETDLRTAHGVVEDELDVSAFLDVLRRRRKLIGIVCTTVLVVAGLLYVVQPRTYRSSTTLQIEREDAVSIAVEDIFRIDGVNSEYYETQYSILRSRGLAEKVVRALGLAQDPVFNPPRASWFGWGALPEEADDAVVLGELASDLLDDLEVNPIRRTHLVEVAYVAPTRELAAKVANGVADAFTNWGIEKRYRTVGRASSFLTSQIETLKEEIADKEAQLQAYSRRTDIVALDPTSNVTLQGLQALNRDYLAAVSTRIDKEAWHRELTSATEEAIADSLSQGLVSQLRTDQAQLERKYANELATYKPNWPTMQELKAQIDKGQQNLDTVILETVSEARQAARTEYQTALRREQSLAAELARKKQEAMELNSASVEYNNLMVEVSTRRSLLDDLLRRQSETMIASRLEGTGESNVIVVDRALIPLRAYRPSLVMNLALGLVLGVMFGVGGAFLVEYLDRTIKVSEEVERVLSVPVLGTIPDISEGSGSPYDYGTRKTKKPGAKPEVSIELLPKFQSRHFASEAYRSLRTALLLSTAEGLRTLVVSSAGPREGKSVTSSNLAVVMAQLGRNVLIVDADLRKPRLHEIFHVSNCTGLVSYLTGHAPLESIVLPTNIPHLFVTPSGPMPPNPAELLSSSRMKAFLEIVREQDYDCIILDTPPVLLVTDATLLGAQSDGVLLCLRSGMVERADASACQERLKVAGVKILGAVLNGAPLQTRYRGGSPYEEYVAASRAKSGAA